MEDKSDNKDQSPGRTTHDMREAAEEAVRRFQQEEDQRRKRRETGPLKGQVKLQFNLVDANIMLNAHLTDSLILGRADPSAQTNADIDLGPHGAYQFGISRRHAMIRLRQQQLELLDLGSRNGTYLNGHKLSAHHPTVITDDDEIRLGKFVIRLNIVPAKS